MIRRWGAVGLNKVPLERMRQIRFLCRGLTGGEPAAFALQRLGESCAPLPAQKLNSRKRRSRNPSVAPRCPPALTAKTSE